MTALQRDRTRLKGEHGGLVAKIAEVNEAISERRILMLQIDEQSRAEVLEQLQDTRARIARLEEQKIAAEDQLRRVEIRSPQAGTVHQLAVHTIGGVVGQGETLMLIVPKGDLLVIEAQVQPRDIAQIVPGQEARVRFPGFDQRTTPELAARVRTISADLARDNVTGARYFVARLFIPDEELARLDGELLVPGMPARPSSPRRSARSSPIWCARSPTRSPTPCASGEPDPRLTYPSDPPIVPQNSLGCLNRLRDAQRVNPLNLIRVMPA